MTSNTHAWTKVSTFVIEWWEHTPLDLATATTLARLLVQCGIECEDDSLPSVQVLRNR